MITIPTTLITARAIAAEHREEADVVYTEGRMSVYLDNLVFVAEIPAPPLTVFPHGYLSRRAAS